MCLPVAYFWDKAIPGGRCLPEQPVWFGNGALNIATDLMILILPMPTFSKLQLAKKQKIGLMLVLALGGVLVSENPFLFLFELFADTIYLASVSLA
jgi:hypothetical protein